MTKEERTELNRILKNLLKSYESLNEGMGEVLESISELVELLREEQLSQIHNDIEA